MSPQEFIDITRDAVYVLLILSLPPLMVTLVVGLSVSLFQALTQIQEQTLTFVPKIVAMLLTLVFYLPFMLNTLTDFTHRLSERMVQADNTRLDTEP